MNLIYCLQDGDTPLHRAASNKLKDVAELFISKGADVDAKNNVRTISIT